MLVPLLKVCLSINKYYNISVYWIFFPCDLLFPCLRVLLSVCASLKIHCTDCLTMWFGGKESCCTVAKQVIQQRGSKDLILAKLPKHTDTWKILQLQKALLKLQNVWNTKITLGYVTLIYLPLDIYITSLTTRSEYLFLPAQLLLHSILQMTILNQQTGTYLADSHCNGKTCKVSHEQDLEWLKKQQ